MHFFTNVIDELEYGDASNRRLNGPTFIGQGLSYHVGSDTYPYAIVDKKIIAGNKTIWGISMVIDNEYETSWTDGSKKCIKPVEWKASQWIIARGKYKDGSMKWWFCDENGKRFVPGQKCKYNWNGAFSYRDPSF